MSYMPYLPPDSSSFSNQLSDKALRKAVLRSDFEMVDYQLFISEKQCTYMAGSKQGIQFHFGLLWTGENTESNQNGTRQQRLVFLMMMIFLWTLN